MYGCDKKNKYGDLTDEEVINRFFFVVSLNVLDRLRDMANGAMAEHSGTVLVNIRELMSFIAKLKHECD